MPPKSSRLGVTTVLEVQKKGLRSSGSTLGISFIKEVPYPAFAVVAPKPGEVTGVERNRLRRRLYSILRKEITPRLQYPTYVVVYARKSAYKLKYNALKTELDSLFLKSGLIYKK